MITCPTPHIDARPGDFAETVLMPGDPLRAAFIAKNFLSGARLVNNVRGVQGYTGTYQGTPVSVMASGMGIPSIGIYSYELFHVFGVKNILRVGSAGALQEGVHLRDVVLGMGACTDSAFADQYRLPGRFAPLCDYTLLSVAVEEARSQGVTAHVGSLLSSDAFYSDTPDNGLAFARMGVLAVEMEAAGLYMTAAAAHARALAICTLSDHIITGESLPAADRQSTFTDMMEIALRTAVRMAQQP